MLVCFFLMLFLFNLLYHTTKDRGHNQLQTEMVTAKTKTAVLRKTMGSWKKMYRSIKVTLESLCHTGPEISISSLGMEEITHFWKQTHPSVYFSWLYSLLVTFLTKFVYVF